MDNQRLLLVAGLFLVSFLLYTEWQRDYAPRPVTPTAATIQAPTPPATTPAVPIAPVAAPEVPGLAPTVAAIETAPRVRVETDVYQLEIDPRGGELTRVALRRYPVAADRPTEPLVLLDTNPEDFFVAQSGLLDAGGRLPNHTAAYTAEQMEYRLADGQDTLTIPLRWTGRDGLAVTKTYTMRRGSYVIDVGHRVSNGGTTALQAFQYRQFQRGVPSASRMFVYTYTGPVFYNPTDNYHKAEFGALDDQPYTKESAGGWAAMIQHYFLGAWIPESTETNAYYARALGDKRYLQGLRSPGVEVAPGASVDFAARLYIGPKDQDTIEALATGLRLTVDYGVLTIIANPLFWLLQKLHGLLANWGLAIIALTMLIKLAFYHLSAASYRSMAQMRRLQPRVASLRERFGDDKQKFNQAMMDLYRTEKINPLGGCLPILVQMPVFIALYWVLLESVELRQAPFMLWIDDLSQEDPYYVLPVLMGLTMFIQQKLNPAPPDPLQAKVFMFLPLIFTVMFLWFPAGLVLYWLVNNVLSIAQQWMITRKIAPETV